MKRHGNISELAHKRAADIVEAYRHYADTHKTINRRKAFAVIANEPAGRFYVSPERAVVVVRKILKGEDVPGMRPLKSEMYREIAARTYKYLQSHAKASLMDAVRAAVESPAPKFYLTPNSTKIIFYKEWKKWTRRNLTNLKSLQKS